MRVLICQHIGSMWVGLHLGWRVVTQTIVHCRHTHKTTDNNCDHTTKSLGYPTTCLLSMAHCRTAQTLHHCFCKVILHPKQSEVQGKGCSRGWAPISRQILYKLGKCRAPSCMLQWPHAWWTVANRACQNAGIIILVGGCERMDNGYYLPV